ncbi:MAG: T9SS type A sorting domain-containing protein [Candidatus Eisenbacteria bacterium]|uniref:T9SS type A sorting domain-containing protein n=1 Tax=Eiseniibacteriota bacterium TaxID=2212470 RepID=A0A7Y2EB78_UNCEI|nr:T9SS type A sorting domain-containing protein [Candidatus Eisenbacteria bacterium]
MKFSGEAPLSFKTSLSALILTAYAIVGAASYTLADPVSYWDLSPLNAGGQLTLFNSDTYDGENGVPVRSLDMNNDGRDEVVVSGIRGDGPQKGPFRDSAGEVHIVFWSEPELDGYIDFREPHPSVIEVLGAQEEEYLGICVAPGDFDNNGSEDLVIGAFGADAPGRVNAGRVYILFGYASMTGGATIDLSQGLPFNMTSITGGAADDRLGVWADSGDLNNDGHLDIVIGADRADAPPIGREQAGKAVIVYGPIPIGVEIDLATWPGPITEIWGIDAEDHLGATVACGDYDGDGIDDAAIAAASHDMSRNVYDSGGSGDGPPGFSRDDAGETWVVFGDPNLPATIDLASPPLGVSTSVFYGRLKFARTGEELATADVNGDQIDDLLIGSLTTSGPPDDYRLNAGEGYVFYGGPGLRGIAEDLKTSTYPRTTIYGTRGSIATDSFTAGDVNGDGFDDLMVGLPCESGPNDRGAGVIMVVYGGANLPNEIDLKTPPPGTTLIEGVDFDDNTAYWAASGDVNGDGFVDVIVNSMTADSWRNSRPVAGEVRVVSGAWLTQHPEPPKNLKVTDNLEDQRISFSWDPSPTPGVTNYLVEWEALDIGPGGSLLVPGTETSCSVEALPNRSPCRFKVRAVMNGLPSRPSPAIVATPGSIPTPENLTLSVVDKNTVQVNWDSISEPNFLGYAVYRFTDSNPTPIRITPNLVTDSFFRDDFAPAYEGVSYFVTAFQNNIFESDPGEAERVFTRPAETGTGLLLVNDYDWAKYTDGSFPNFLGDPWEMYDARVMTGDQAFTFWDFREGFANYPSGYVPVGTGPLNPDVLFDHGAIMILANGPDDGQDTRLKEQSELLLEFRAAGGVVIAAGWLLGSYLPANLSKALGVLDWDQPVSVVPTRVMTANYDYLAPSVGPEPVAGAAVFCDVPEFDPSANIRVLYEYDFGEQPPLMHTVMRNNVESDLVLSASPSYLDPISLKSTMNEILLRLGKARFGVGVDEETPTPLLPVSLAYPNPTRGAAFVDFQLERPGKVSAKIFDIRGRILRQYNQELQTSGSGRVVWDGTDERGREVAGGVYFIQVKSQEFTTTRRVLRTR